MIAGEMVVDGDENMNEFKCFHYEKKFNLVYNLNKHIKNVHEEKKLKCRICSYKTNDTPSMQSHTESCMKRKREGDVVEQNTKRIREEDLNNQVPMKMKNLITLKVVLMGLCKQRFGNIMDLKIY